MAECGFCKKKNTHALRTYNLTSWTHRSCQLTDMNSNFSTNKTIGSFLIVIFFFGFCCFKWFWCLFLMKKMKHAFWPSSDSNTASYQFFNVCVFLSHRSHHNRLIVSDFQFEKNRRRKNSQ